MDDSDPFDFIPVALRCRRDGWTPERQRLFIIALAGGLRAGAAAAAAGMSRKSAYQLRARPDAGGFSAAWERALQRCQARRAASRPATLAERALYGVWRPQVHKGEVVGWSRKPDNRRLIGLLKRLDKAADRLSAAAGTSQGLDFAGDAPGALPSIRREHCHLPPSGGG